MQSLPYWGQDSSNQLLVPCNAYELTRIEQSDLWYVEYSFKNCYGQDTIIYLSPPNNMKAFVCAHTPPVLSTNSPAGSGAASSTLVGACENNVPVGDCGKVNTYNGGQSFPTTIRVVLGTATGNVFFDYNALGVPDKFIVIYNGAEVINTGYRGNIDYQSNLNSSLTSRGLPTETIQGIGSGYTGFYKATNFPIVAFVQVWAPLEGTQWNFTLACPV